MPEGRSRSGADDAELSLELVQRIQGGDRAAWERLYLRYHDRLLLAIRCRLGPRLRATLESEDVFQSVMADALEDLREFTPRGPGSLERWLHVCVLNKVRSKAAHYGATFRAGIDAHAPSELERRAPAAPEYFDLERFGALERAIAELDDELREVIVARAVEGAPNAEVAAQIGKSPEATSKLYNRALARLALRVDKGLAL